MTYCTKDNKWLVSENIKSNYREENFTFNISKIEENNNEKEVKQKQLDKQIALQARINFICRILEIS